MDLGGPECLVLSIPSVSIGIAGTVQSLLPLVSIVVPVLGYLTGS